LSYIPDPKRLAKRLNAMMEKTWESVSKAKAEA